MARPGLCMTGDRAVVWADVADPAAVAGQPMVMALAVVMACLVVQWALEIVGARALFNGPLARPRPAAPPRWPVLIGRR